MKKTSKTILVSILVVAAALVGCQVVDEPISIDNLPKTRVSTQAMPVAVADQTDPTLENRFLEPEQTNASAVDSALMWSQKYDELLKKNEQLMEKNHTLFIENTDLQQKLTKLQGDLEATQAELADANTFLQEMHGELTKWKADVLGFRDEMRNGQTSQLQALSKILQILGAEPVSPTNQVAKN